MFDQFEELRQDFVVDTLPLVQGIEEILLEIERLLGSRGSFESELTEVLRRLHTVKGNAGMMGFAPLQSLAHRMEDLVNAATTGALTPGQDALDVLLEAVAALAGMVQAVATREEGTVETAALYGRFERLLDAPAAERGTLLPLVDRGDLTRPSGHDAIRVDFRKLDQLLNLVGELVIYQTGLARTIGALRPKLAAEDWRDLERTAELFGKTVAELQGAVMQTRLLPVSTVFGKFPRMVRDLAKGHGKQIEVVLEGAHTEIDKTVLDALADPLLHLVRNSVDHGIETPIQRRDAGKPAQGRIVLGAAQAGKQIRIEVVDDGRGIDPQRIAARAQELGVDTSGLEPRKLLDLMFLPGFSTAESVTELSGRGVGLSVVRHNIERLGGHLMVASAQGQGARFTLLVPLTLAIIEALVLDVAGQSYALPVSGVLETVRLDRRRLHRVGATPVFEWRDRTVPVLDLGLRFGLGRSALDEAAFAVAIFGAGRLVILPVDRLHGREELVVKGLDGVLGETPGIAGATILGTGQVLLVLDVASLLQPEA